MSRCPLVGRLCSGAKSAVQGVVSSGFDAVVKAFTDGLTTTMKALLTFWTDVPTTTVGDPRPAARSGGPTR